MKQRLLLMSFLALFAGFSAGAQNNPQGCDDFRYYLANFADGVSDIYGIQLNGGEAEMTWLKSLDYGLHIAYNPSDDLLYIVRSSNGSFRTLDVSVVDGALSDEVALDVSASSCTAAGVNNDGKLVIGSGGNAKVYIVEADGTTAEFGDANVSGGDLVVRSSGEIVLATNTGNYLQTVMPGNMANPVIGDLPGGTVTGLALTSDEDYLYSLSGGSALVGINDNGTSNGESFQLTLEGESFTHNFGDLSSACQDSEDVEECSYQLYYTHEGPGQNGYALWEVTLNDDNTASYVELQANIGGAHIALSPSGNELYIVSGSNVRTYDLGTNTITNDVNIATAGGQNLSGFPSAVCDENGVLYAGDDGANQVYTIDPLTGLATAFGPGVPLNGGDLIFVADELWSIHRGDNKAYLVSDGGATSFDIPVNQMNGAAVLDNGNIFVADGGTMLFKELDISDINNVSIVAEYNTGVALNNGDLAGQCVNNNPVIPENPGECNATEVIEYIEGTSSNGGNIAQNRTDASQALGDPERIDQLVFVSLGYGGSLTLAFDGTVANIEGDDLEIVETTYGNSSCASYFEFADVYVSLDGEQFYFAETICRSDNFVDISSAPVELAYISQIKIVNNDELSTTPDAFDVDGVVALANCDFAEDEGEEAGLLAQENSSNAVALSAYPNPSVGQSTVTFEMNSTERATLELYDMNGRVVAEIFNQVANANQEYRFDFNATNLPEGVYIYRLTTQNSVTVEKFILSK